MILLDGMMQVYRAAYCMIDLQNTEGRPTGMEYGFLKSLEALRRFFKDELIICWEGNKNFRYGIDPNYKQSRLKKRQDGKWAAVTKDRLIEFRQILAMVAENAWDAELEGDDVIATLTQRYSKTEKVLIYSNDKDLYQCLRLKGKESFPVEMILQYQQRHAPFSFRSFKQKCYGIDPEHWPLMQAWIGDKVDDIPGCGRVRKDNLGAALLDNVPAEKMHEYDLFSVAESAKIEEHYKSGRYAKNLQLVTLKIKPDLKVIQRDWRPKTIAKYLDMMEIRALNICREVGAGGRIRDGEEF